MTRPGNCLLAVASVWIGGYLTAGLKAEPALIITSLGVFFICAGGNLVNDIIDIRIDAVIHPERPLPSGRAGHRGAIWWGIAVHLVSLALVLVTPPAVRIVGLVAIALLLVYNFWLKRVPILGNIVVAGLASLTFVCGGIAVASESVPIPGPYVAAGMAFLFHLIREIVKDIEDMEGDRRVNGLTLPLWIGKRGSMAIAVALFVVLAVVSVLPAVVGWYGVAYLFVVLLGLNIPLGALLLLAFWKTDPVTLARARRGLKLGMVVGLAALLVA